MSLSARIAVMHHGHLAQVGTPEELYERPQSRFVASFLGDANFLPGTVVRGLDDGVCEVRVEGVGDFTLQNGKPHAVGARVDLSLRPERISLALEKPSATPSGTAFPAVVQESTYLGKAAHVRAMAGGHRLTIEVTYDEIGGALSRLEKGTPVWLFARHADALILEPEGSA